VKHVQPKKSPKPEHHDVVETVGTDVFENDDEYESGPRWIQKDKAEKIRGQKINQDERPRQKPQGNKSKLVYPRSDQDEEIQHIRDFILSQLPPNLTELVKQMNNELEQDFKKRKNEIAQKMLDNEEDDRMRKRAKEEIAKQKQQKQKNKQKQGTNNKSNKPEIVEEPKKKN